MSWGSVFLAAIGAVGVVQLLDSASKKKKGCRIPTEQAIFQANNAILSGDPQKVQAVLAIFEGYGCHGEAAAMRDWIVNHGYNPDVPIVQTNVPMPMAGPGEVTVQPGETWRAAAVLGAVGCAVSLDTIREKVQEKGFSQVSVYAKNPWGKGWESDAGFLECTRYIQATVVGKVRNERKPKQVYKLERVSVAT